MHNIRLRQIEVWLRLCFQLRCTTRILLPGLDMAPVDLLSHIPSLRLTTERSRALTRARRGSIPYSRQDRFTSARLVHFTKSQQRCKSCKTHSCHASIITCISLGKSNQIQPRSTNHSPHRAKNQHQTSRTHLTSQAEQAQNYTPFLPHRARPSALRLTSEVMSHT
jgi:hypothetical protein